MFPQTLTGIQLNFSGAERTRAIGLYSIALSIGMATLSLSLLLVVVPLTPGWSPLVSTSNTSSALRSTPCRIGPTWHSTGSGSSG